MDQKLIIGLINRKYEQIIFYVFVAFTKRDCIFLITNFPCGFERGNGCTQTLNRIDK